MSEKVSVAEVVAQLVEKYPLELAEGWDKNGLIVGSVNQPVKRVLVAVDPTHEVVDQAIAEQCDLIVTHHPLFLRGVNFLADDTPKGLLVKKLIKNDIALYNCHTNADSARDGVAQSMAKLLGLQDARPMSPTDGTDKTLGLGRIGELSQPMTLRELGRKVAEVLPKCPAGVLVGGDLDATVRRIAVSPGAGDSFLELARKLEADVYICADLRHHPASEHLEGGKPYLINATHWATEWPWVPRCAAMLRSAFSAQELEVIVSEIVTDPWAEHFE